MVVKQPQFTRVEEPTLLCNQLVVKDLDLRSILITFPVGEDGELWPWLVRVAVHVMDRLGKRITDAL